MSEVMGAIERILARGYDAHIKGLSKRQLAEIIALFPEAAPFRAFLRNGDHFRVEALDSLGWFHDIDTWIGSNAARRAFVQFHMGMTVFNWKYPAWKRAQLAAGPTATQSAASAARNAAQTTGNHQPQA